MQKVTIGIPFFNSVKYLDKCIQSVLAQTFSSWELILVDDGSTDGSYGVCKKYGSRDERIHVIRGTHQGIGEARNKVIDYATGDYLCFMDADDWYEPDYLASLLSNANVDLVVCGYKVDRYNKVGEIITSEDHIQPALSISSERERLRLEQAFSSGIMCFIWNKLFRMEVIRQYKIRYNSYPVNEDFIFVLDYMRYTRTVTILPKALYHWVRVEGNLSAVESIPENIVQIYEQSHCLLAQYLKSEILADKIVYFTYELIIYKYLKLYSQGVISSSECYKSLAKLHLSQMVRRSFKAYKPTTRAEKVFFMLNKHGLFRITNIIQKIISKWK